MSKDSADAGGIALPPGTMIGKYEVVEKIGIGGQAVIYKCRDSLLDRLVAVKQISSTLAADPTFVERFRKEAKTVARLGAEQPSIVTIHELLENDQGLFIVMEYLQGNTLEAALADRGEPIETKAALQILWRLAAAMHAIHAAGIIHRDMKPSNIIIGEGLRVTVADFGVAVSATGQTSMMLGTTKYMAPELFGGGLTDARADIYSLGMIAYEMLTGREKFRHVFADIIRDPHSESLRWMKWHGNKRVSAPPLTEVNPAVPKALSDIVARMMAKDPDERFESAEALGRAIKLGFSARAKAPVGAAAPAIGALGEGHAGDDLVIAQVAGAEPEFEAGATAPLPKQRISLKTKLIVAGAVFLALLGTVVVMTLRSGAEEKKRIQAAKKLFAKAKALYDDGKHAEAAAEFKKVYTGGKGTSEAVKARPMASLAAGFAAVDNQQFKEAGTWQKKAEGELTDIQTSYDGDLAAWAGQMMSADPRNEGDVARLGRKRQAAKKFHEAWSKAQALYEKKQYDKIREVFRQLRDVKLDKELQGRRDKLLKLCQKQLFLVDLNATIERGKNAALQANLKEARNAYREALQKLDETKVLPPDEAKKHRHDLHDRLGTIEQAADYGTAIEGAAAAATDGDLDKALLLYRGAHKLRPSEALKATIARLAQRRDRDKIEEIIKDQDIPKAIKALEQFAKEYPDNTWAPPLLRGLRNQQLRGELIADGSEAFDKENWELAKHKYREANRISPDAELQAKIATCEFRLLMRQARAAFGEKKYDEAIRLAEQARAMRQDQAATIDVFLADVARHKKYDLLIATATDALKTKSFARAKAALKEAKRVMPARAEEADKLLIEAKHAELVHLGDEAMKNKEYKAARAYYRLAQQHKHTVTVAEKLAEAEMKLTESGQGGD